MQDVVGGQVDLTCLAPSALAPRTCSRQGPRLRLHVEDALAGAPEVPTTDEAGVPGLHLPFWQAFWVPKGTPKDVVDKLNAAVVEALADPAYAEAPDRARRRDPAARAADAGGACARFVKAEIDKWRPIIEAANIKPDQ